MKTTDGGGTWINRSISTWYPLRSVEFVNDNIGTIVGDAGIILRTTNGWYILEHQKCNYNLNLSGVYSSDDIKWNGSS